MSESPWVERLTFADGVARTLARWGERDAVVFPKLSLRWSYAEFGAEVGRLARAFLGAGIEAGEHVGIWSTKPISQQERGDVRVSKGELQLVQTVGRVDVDQHRPDPGRGELANWATIHAGHCQEITINLSGITAWLSDALCTLATAPAVHSVARPAA